MARQPDVVEGIQLDLSGIPGGMDQFTSGDVQVGHIYRPRSGQTAFWWVVSITQGDYHHTAVYLIFNTRGECTGVSKCGVNYLGERSPVGHADVPMITPSWL
jgi:hypothetical protein